MPTVKHRPDLTPLWSRVNATANIPYPPSPPRSIHRTSALGTLRGPHVHGPSTILAPDLEDVVALGAFPLSLGNDATALGACQVPAPLGLGLHLGEAQPPGLPSSGV